MNGYMQSVYGVCSQFMQINLTFSGQHFMPQNIKTSKNDVINLKNIEKGK